MTKTAIVLFNLGGPDGPDAVEPFLFNLFSDPAIIGLPQPLRWVAARLAAKRRAGVARDIYARLGGSSPLLENTRRQAAALAAALGGDEHRVFPCMRYWHPMAAAVAAEVRDFAPDRIVLLPLYPQYSSTTTRSSVRAWRHAAGAAGLTMPTKLVCCYATEPGLLAALAERTRRALAEAAAAARAPRVLFSAHGLPKRVVARGDPYQRQVEHTAAALAAWLGLEADRWAVCYQSRVGPLEWIGPSTEDELRRAGRDGVAVALVPIAFVSEHSETLVELDMDYRALARRAGVPAYVRAATVGTSPAFIDGLADLVRGALDGAAPVRPESGRRRCAAGMICGLNEAV
ncbi:MAG TPA: ferrochelatase [Dongiaceae bacterium]|nr:ferrochelatase [Dongiaceae bacterium]